MRLPRKTQLQLNHKRAPEAFDAPIFKQKCQTRFRASFTRSMIAKDKDDMAANRRRFLRRDEDIQR